MPFLPACATPLCQLTVARCRSQLLCRPGPRLVDALEFLVGLLNDKPELIPAGFPWFYYKPSDQAAAAEAQ